MVGLLAGVVLWLIIVGRFSSRSGLDQAIGWKSAREVIERREQLDAEDVSQMLAARNARRRARGEREVTLEEMEFQVMSDVREQQQLRERYLEERRQQQVGERELDQLLEATNARRRARGLPERTREQAQREFGSGSDKPARG